MSEFLHSTSRIHDSREHERRYQESLKRDLLVLVYSHLKDEGLCNAAEAMRAELLAWDPDEWEICDNVDLPLVLMEYSAYFQMRFHRRPKLTRKRTKEPVADDEGPSLKRGKRRELVRSSAKSGGYKNKEGFKQDFLQVGNTGSENTNTSDHRPLSIPKQLLSQSDNRDLAAQIVKDAVVSGSNLNGTSWDDVVGHEDVKQAMEEMLILPQKHPDLYSRAGLQQRTQAILLTGPPGTGKTLLAQSLSARCCSSLGGGGESASFICLQPSTMSSKWRGESEKLVRVAFEIARHNAPSVLFLDEAEAIIGERGGPNEHEASLRAKAEFLIQLDGLRSDSEPVLVIGSTNLPWSLDAAILRRFQRVFSVPLPDQAERELILKQNMKQVPCADINYSEITKPLDGYSGSDLARAANEAKRRLFRRMVEDREQKAANRKVKPLCISTEDLRQVLEHTKPLKSALKWQERFLQWKSQDKRLAEE